MGVVCHETELWGEGNLQEPRARKAKEPFFRATIPEIDPCRVGQETTTASILRKVPKAVPFVAEPALSKSKSTITACQAKLAEAGEVNNMMHRQQNQHKPYQ